MLFLVDNRTAQEQMQGSFLPTPLLGLAALPRRLTPSGPQGQCPGISMHHARQFLGTKSPPHSTSPRWDYLSDKPEHKGLRLFPRVTHSHQYLAPRFITVIHSIFLLKRLQELFLPPPQPLLNQKSGLDKGPTLIHRVGTKEKSASA